MHDFAKPITTIKKGTVATVSFDKLVFGGQALGRLSNKVVLAWNVLPGETVDVAIIKNKSTHIEACGQHVRVRSTFRIEPVENHYLSCSPWQIIAWQEENSWKARIAQETYQKIGHFSLPHAGGITSNEYFQYKYRNKMEYSFTHTENKPLSLAFFQRGSHQRIPIDACRLADDAINQTARHILTWLTHYKFPPRSLKSLIIRCNEKGETLAGLFIKDRLSIIKNPPPIAHSQGIRIFYSTPRCPAARADELVYTAGENYLTTNIHTTTLHYGLLSFFQVNVPLFQVVLNDIKPYLDSHRTLIDFYSGVGAISIPLAKYCKRAILIENNDEAVAYAQKNINANEVHTFTIHHASTEKATDYITPDTIVLFDPPRSGLHKKIIKTLLQQLPVRIIYLSCNIATQARDIAMLLDHYTISMGRLYNFFPRTPHIEGLIILDRNTH